MASDHRSLIEFGYYREGLQRFEYFIVGVSLALCAYVGQTLHPEKLGFLSAYTIEVVSLALLIVSAVAGFKRIGITYPTQSAERSATRREGKTGRTR
jgi:hypothetical protein